MNKIIGGLLVLSLLSRASAIDTNNIAYDVFRTKHQIVYIIKKDTKHQEIKKEDINEMMEYIEDDVRVLNTLIKEKNNVIEKIKAIMDLKAFTKTPMSKQQIDGFRKFNDVCKENNEKLKELFNTIDPKDELKQIQREIMHKDTDMKYVYSKLNKLKELQTHAIESLENINDIGMKTIEIL